MRSIYTPLISVFFKVSGKTSKKNGRFAAGISSKNNFKKKRRPLRDRFPSKNNFKKKRRFAPICPISSKNNEFSVFGSQNIWKTSHKKRRPLRGRFSSKNNFKKERRFAPISPISSKNNEFSVFGSQNTCKTFKKTRRPLRGRFLQKKTLAASRPIFFKKERQNFKKEPALRADIFKKKTKKRFFFNLSL